MASGERSTRSKSLQDIVQFLHHCTELEAWGLVVELSDEFLKASQKLKNIASQEDDSFSSEEKAVFVLIAHVLQQRAKSIQDLSSVQEPSSTSTINVKRIKTALEGLLEGSMTAATMKSSLSEILPVDGGGVTTQGEQERSLVLTDDEYSKAAQAKSGSLVPKRDMLPGFSYLTITIDKIGIKDPHNYLDPYITVSVKSLLGEDVEGPQDTPVANQRESNCIGFGESVLVRTPIEEIAGGTAIFFEFKHYKPKKKTVSTKCFSFMEMDEVKPGKAVLEIYRKPTDYRRKKLFLLSVKPLYLHLTLTIDKPS